MPTLCAILKKIPIMIKHLTFFIFSLFIFLQSFSQKKDFEGEIVYAQTITSKTANYSSEDLKRYFGDTIIITIKAGNYRHKILNSSGITDIIYLSNVNRWYYKLGGIDTLYFHDCAIEDNKILEISKLKDTFEIAGFHCQVLTIKTVQATNTFYYTDSLYKDPQYFVHHNFTNYNAYINETKSIYLKQTISSDLFDGEISAFQVLQKPVSNEVFALPNLPTSEK